MQIFLALVAVMAAFTLFDTELPKLIASFGLYVPLVVPFFLAYSRVEKWINMALLLVFSVVFLFAVVTVFFSLTEFLPVSGWIELLRLAKRYLRRRRFRFLLSLISILVFAAGITFVCEFATIMLGNVHERRGDILTLAAVGLNPSRLAGLFLIEALIVGFLGGGMGYAAGLSISIVASLPLAEIELSTGWIVTVLLASLAAALTASIQPSIKASMVATPSLERRWWRRAFPPLGWPPTWTVKIPVKVRRETIDSFFAYFTDYVKWLERFPPTSIERTENVQVLSSEPVEGGEVRRLRFNYIFGGDIPPRLMTENELKASRSPQLEEYTINFTVKVTGHSNINVHQALERIVSTYRQMAFEWTEASNFTTAVKVKPLPRSLIF
ncbi:MAG: ABC transporter permease [Candidatus Bathyarchaeia archaeon]